MSRATTLGVFVATLTCVSPALAEQPLAIAKQGYFFVGGKYSPVGDKQVMNGQIYVEYQIPEKRTQSYPLVIVPGAAQTATNFNGTPDGREGWTQHFLRRGYAVYIVEQPGRGRSSYQPDTDGTQAYPEVLRVQQRFTAPEKFALWPQARLHTQWPGTGTAGDPNFDEFFASQVPFVQKPEVTQALNRDAIAALIDKLGPVILMTHSQSRAYGWEAVDQRPGMVKALIHAEPSAPPVMMSNSLVHPNGSATVRAPAPGVSPRSRPPMRRPQRTPRSLHSNGRTRQTARTSPDAGCRKHRRGNYPICRSCRSPSSPARLRSTPPTSTAW